MATPVSISFRRLSGDDSRAYGSSPQGHSPLLGTSPAGQLGSLLGSSPPGSSQRGDKGAKKFIDRLRHDYSINVGLISLCLVELALMWHDVSAGSF